MIKVFVAWMAPELSRKAQEAIAMNSAEELRRIQQTSDLADEIWRSWATANDGSVISCEPGQGILEIHPEKLTDLKQLQTQYGQAIGSYVAIGVGKAMDEAMKAAKSVQEHGTDGIAMFNEANPDELNKSIPGMAVQPPAQQPDPAMPEPLADRLHALALKQHQEDSITAAMQSSKHDALKSNLAGVLQNMKAQLPVIAQLKEVAPEAYQAIMDLVMGLIEMGRAIQPQHITPQAGEPARE